MTKNCRNCRKFGEKLFLKGERCSSPKCALARRVNTPGTAPAKGTSQVRRRKKSEYGIQLQEKQKAKTDYGLREKQFRLVYEKGVKRELATGEAMLQILELRLDNVVYRMGLTSSRAAARQMVNHGHIKVNGKVLDIPSYQTKVKDVIEPVKPVDPKKIIGTSPKWLKMDKKLGKAEISSLPTRDEIETAVDEQLIVEYYSR